MTGVAYQLTTDPPLRDLQGRFTKANASVLENHRELMRTQGRRLVDLMQEEAPSRSGDFARGIRFRTSTIGGMVTLEITTPQPLGKFIIEGTRAHVITAKRAQMLAFPWAAGPFGVRGMGGTGLHFYYSVAHPGTKANRFHGRAVRRWKPGARADLRRMALRYTDTLAGKR